MRLMYISKWEVKKFWIKNGTRRIRNSIQRKLDTSKDTIKNIILNIWNIEHNPIKVRELFLGIEGTTGKVHVYHSMFLDSYSSWTIVFRHFVLCNDQKKLFGDNLHFCDLSNSNISRIQDPYIHGMFGDTIYSNSFHNCCIQLQ